MLSLLVQRLSSDIHKVCFLQIIAISYIYYPAALQLVVLIEECGQIYLSFLPYSALSMRILSPYGHTILLVPPSQVVCVLSTSQIITLKGIQVIKGKWFKKKLTFIQDIFLGQFVSLMIFGAAKVG